MRGVARRSVDQPIAQSLAFQHGLGALGPKDRWRDGAQCDASLRALAILGGNHDGNAGYGDGIASASTEFVEEIDAVRVRNGPGNRRHQFTRFQRRFLVIQVELVEPNLQPPAGTV